MPADLATEPKRFAIVGCGAVGSFYGARLARAGHAVHFLLRSDYAHVQRHGIEVRSIDGDFKLSRVAAHADPGDVPACDVIVVALKTTANATLTHLLPQLTHSGATIFVLQNGLGAEETIAQVVPQARIVGGLCFVGVRRVGPGRIEHQAEGHISAASFAPGGRDAGIGPELRALRSAFAKAGIEVKLEPSLGLARWRKLVWNVPFNGLSTVLRASTRDLMDCASTRALARELMLEVIAGATACGHPIPREAADELLATTDRMPAYLPSMRLDFDAGRALEIDAIYAAPLAAARAAGCVTPRIEMLYQQLCLLDPRDRERAGAGA